MAAGSLTVATLPAVPFWDLLGETGGDAPGLQIATGATAPQKVANMAGGVQCGLFAPVEIVSRA